MIQGHDNTRKGFSLAEAIMATVVLAIAAAGVLLPFSGGVSVRAEGIHRTTGAVLAADLMEKIVDANFVEIVDKFNNYTEAAGQVKDAQGHVFTDPGYAKFSRSSTCSYFYVSQEKTASNAKFILATVSVYYSGKPVAIINQLISK